MKIGDIEITDIQRLTLRPGDRLMVKTEHPLEQNQREYVRRKIAEWVGDVPILVYPKELEITVIGKGNEPEVVTK